MTVFYVLAAISIWLGIASLRGGLRFARYLRFEVTRPLPDFKPFASVIAPCRGIDPGLRENVAALFHQHYPAYEIIFIADRVNDPSLEIIRAVIDSEAGPKQVPTRVIISGSATDCGQKVHNLRSAVVQVDRRSEVLVFVDTDARPQPEWLQSLVAPLRDDNLGATTGYRWFLPASGGLATHFRSVWNASIASALGENEHKNFCWGGSTAIRRATFDELGVKERWRGTVSDDFTLTRVLQEANLPIHFVPDCLIASVEDCTWKELFEFTNRQLKITRTYASHLWKAVMIGSSIFAISFFGGAALVTARAALGLSVAIPAALVGIMFVLGAVKSYLRWRAISILLVRYDREWKGTLLPHLLLWPLASLLFLCNALAATFSRRIKWRGITYELKSPSEAVIIARE